MVGNSNTRSDRPHVASGDAKVAFRHICLILKETAVQKTVMMELKIYSRLILRQVQVTQICIYEADVRIEGERGQDGIADKMRRLTMYSPSVLTRASLLQFCVGDCFPLNAALLPLASSLPALVGSSTSKRSSSSL